MNKELDRAWHKGAYAVACPHCRGGLLPEDFADSGLALISREMEEARRKRGKTE